MKNIRKILVRLHRCERGAEGLEKLLIMAAIVLPLLGVLIFFRNDLIEWFESLWTDVQDDADNLP
ncbi:MAG: hypothetical protein CMJ49_06875 [Planctomycetaceae bacterium]|nr:hypothetical protein [Planctomycetaceae bacterium]